MIDAISCSNSIAQQTSLFAAYEGFTDLINLDPRGITSGIQVTVPNEKLIGLGYEGRFCYFALIGCTTMALEQVYEFCSIFPKLGAQMYGNCMFSGNFKDQLGDLDKEIGDLTRETVCDTIRLCDGIPINQLVPLLEIEREEILNKIVSESKVILGYLREQKATVE
jgi:hypothetical protein